MAKKVVLLNSLTCGIHKMGTALYKTDPVTGKRTNQIDNQLSDDVSSYLDGVMPPGSASVDLATIFQKRILVPTYFDDRHDKPIQELLADNDLEGVTVGKLIEEGHLRIRAGHGSPGNDQRKGTIPYIKVSDIRGLRINVNPTNLVTEAVASGLWGRGHGRKPGKISDSGLLAWDVITPNRASSNIGEFAILVPGEEQIVLTKEVFVFRVVNDALFDQFYLLWALCLKSVREQWRRIALMQTNREDCGNRHVEIVIPRPKNQQWAADVSAPFRDYFTTLDRARTAFLKRTTKDDFEYIAGVRAAVS